MVSTLKNATKEDKGSPVPWADPKGAPWFDPKWSKGSKGDAYPEDNDLCALGGRAEEFGFAGGSLDLVARNDFTAALRAGRMHIRYAQWSSAMARMMHAMAVLGCLGPAGLSVASNYLAVLSELAAERGAEFAIAYDRELHRHLKSEVVAVSEVAPYLNTRNDGRAAALQRMFDNEKTERVNAARRPAPAAGGKGGGGKGGKGAPPGA